MLLDEAKRGRNQLRDQEDRSNRIGDNPGDVLISTPAKTIANGSTYPTATNVYYWVQPLRETGLERVGVSPTFANTGVPILAKHIGTTAPPVNSIVLVTPASGRNSFLY